MAREVLTSTRQELIREFVNAESNGSDPSGANQEKTIRDVYRKALRDAAFPPPDKK